MEYDLTLLICTNLIGIQKTKSKFAGLINIYPKIRVNTIGRPLRSNCDVVTRKTRTPIASQQVTTTAAPVTSISSVTSDRLVHGIGVGLGVGVLVTAGVASIIFYIILKRKKQTVQEVEVNSSYTYPIFIAPQPPVGSAANRNIQIPPEGHYEALGNQDTRMPPEYEQLKLYENTKS